MDPKLKTIGFGSHGHVQKSENREHEGFLGYSKVKSKRYYSRVKQNNSTELSGHSFLKIYSRNGPPEPPDPTSGFPRETFFFLDISTLPATTLLIRLLSHSADVE